MHAAVPLTQPIELALEANNLCKRYGARWALARVSFSVPRGAALLLTGHNGSGKTTLLRLVSTAMRPTAGALKVLGRDVVAQRDEVRQEVALLSHASFLYEDLSAFQNLVVLARLLGVDDPEAEAGALLDRVGLTKRSTSAVRQFSAGMRKRLAIARLLLKRPKLALLDEPFGELDPAGIAQMEAIIRELHQGGTTMVLATHLVEQGQSLCDRRLHLSDGRAVSA
jgi:heme exporter protein A